MRKIFKVLTAALTPIFSLCTLLAGCGVFSNKEVSIDNSGIMQDIDVAPEQNAAYEEYSKQAVSDYKEVANQHTDKYGDIDIENEEVIQAANTAAAKLYAYACYNERTLDKYVYFSDQEGNTDLGGSGSATARRQEYYLRVNESADTCGYRYHYTIKKVTQSKGTIGTLKGLFESARIRVTDKTNLLYRFEGDTSTLKFSEEKHEKLGCDILECDWKTGKDWGKPDVEMKKEAFIAPEDIEADIVSSAGEDNVTIRGNINILAENIVKKAIISDDGEGGIFVSMWVNTEAANRDEASLKMLRKGNSSDDCVWTSDANDEDDTGMFIGFRLWSNGLFRFYGIQERWSGQISGFKGTVDSSTNYYYSYTDRDCDMTKNLEMLAEAKKAKGE